MRLVPSYDLATHARNAIAPLRPWTTLHFDPVRWHGLCDATARQLGCEPNELGRMHEVEATRGDAPRKNRRRTTGSRVDVEALESLVRTYEAFVCDVVCAHVADRYVGGCDEIIFQALPSLRVAVPSDKASGIRHRDGAYGHQPGQINFWLPLAPAFGHNTLWLEPPTTGDAGDGAEDVGAGQQRYQSAAAWPLEGDFGTLHRFHGHQCFHYTRPNDTPATRVSLDFRVVPGPCYEDDWAASRAPTGAQSFFLGGYYAKARFDGDRWRVCRESKPELLCGNAARRAGTAGAARMAPRGD